MSASEEDMRRKLTVVRDHCVRTVIAIAARVERFTPSGIEELRQAVTAAVLEAMRIGMWWAANRRTQPPPPPAFDDEPTQPSKKG